MMPRILHVSILVLVGAVLLISCKAPNLQELVNKAVAEQKWSDNQYFLRDTSDLVGMSVYSALDYKALQNTDSIFKDGERIVNKILRMVPASDTGTLYFFCNYFDKRGVEIGDAICFIAVVEHGKIKDKFQNPKIWFGELEHKWVNQHLGKLTDFPLAANQYLIPSIDTVTIVNIVDDLNLNWKAIDYQQLDALSEKVEAVKPHLKVGIAFQHRVTGEKIKYFKN